MGKLSILHTRENVTLLAELAEIVV